MRRASSLLALAWLATARTAAAAGALPADAAARIDAVFADWSAPDGPGCAVGVVRDGELALARSFGLAHLEHGVPIDARSVFDVGSVSKQMTAAAIALLAIDGKLDLDDDVRRFVPELPPGRAPVTLRHLLHHRGGLREYTTAMELAGHDVADLTTTEQALASIVAEDGVDFAPGERYEYSNTGYLLLGLVVERASGRPLARFAEERLFAPLGMHSTHFHDDHTLVVPRRAQGYARDDDGRYGIAMSDWEQVGDGSLFTTVEDLARWVGNLETGAVGGPRFVELMASAGEPTGEEGGGSYGFAQSVTAWRGRRVLRHGGSWAGYRAHLLHIPDERLAVAVLCNFREATGLGARADAVAAIALGESPDPPPLRIDNARLFDGTGAPARTGSLRIAGDRIAAVGELEPIAGEEVFDARGLALAPGFVDTHSHADSDLADHPAALGAVSQGITTIVGGQDGGSFLPLADFFARLEREPAAVNVASYSGHGTLREEVLGDDYRREATPAEVEAMARLLEADLAAGALGLSTGLEYDPGIYSERAELIALARVAARHGGRYISHVRSEDRWFWEAIDEILAIGREARLPVQISHLKLAMRSLWGEAPRLLARLEAARAEGIDVTADLYPYLYWQSTLTVLFPERDFEDLEEARRVLAEIAPADGLLLGRYAPNPGYAGRTVAQIAAERGEEPAVTLLALIRDAEAMRAAGGEDVESVIGTSMTEGDLEALMRWPHTNLCTDGGLDGSHPRGFGSYPRVLGSYVRERGVLSLEEAVRRMTSLAADHVGIRDRGRLVAGAFADLVLFDPATVIDRATTSDPHALSAGIERVWVNGSVVFANGAATGERPGRVLRRQPAPPSP